MNEKEKDKGKEKASDSSADKKPQKDGNKSKILFMGILAAALVFNVIVAVVLIQMTKPKNPAEKEAEAKADSLQLHQAGTSEMGEIGEPIDAIVNIAGTNGERLLKVVVRLEFPAVRKPVNVS